MGGTPSSHFGVLITHHIHPQTEKFGVPPSSGCSHPKTYELDDVSCFMSTCFLLLLQFLVRDYTGADAGQYLWHANIEGFEQALGFGSWRGNA